MNDEVERAIATVHEELVSLGYADATLHDAARLFSKAMDGVIEHVTDPRALGGEIAGPGGPFEHGNVVIDASRALLVDYQDVAKVDEGARGQEVFAFMFAGRINRTPDRASVVLLGDLDFMAATITEMHGVAERAGLQARLRRQCDERWAQMPHQPGDL